MQRRYSSRKLSFRNKKHQARHQSGGGFNFAFLERLLHSFAANKLRFITVAIAAAAIIIALIVIVLPKPVETSAQVPPPSSAAASDTPESTGTTPPPVDSKAENYDQVDTQKVDDATLAGLTGEGLQDEQTGDVSEAELKGSIGVVFDNVNSVQDTTVLQKIERASASAIKDGKIGLVKFYNAKGDLNQQIQDMRSMINKNAKAIIIDVSDKDTYIMLTKMAKDAKIPVVAINSPAAEGYEVNIAEDIKAYGQKSAEFITQKLTAGSVLEVYGQNMDTAEQQRMNLIKAAITANANIKSVGSLTLENKADKIKAALDPIIKANPTIDAVVVGQGMAKNVLNALFAQNIIPKVVSADSTAGFIKTWYALKKDGVSVAKSVVPEDTSKKPASKKSPAKTETPKPETVVVKALGGEVFCAESSPYGIGGTAIQFALRLSEGKKLKSAALTNNTYTYSPKVVMTDENLEQYYQQFKDEADDYIISDWIPDADIDAMFE